MGQQSQAWLRPEHLLAMSSAVIFSFQILVLAGLVGFGCLRWGGWSGDVWFKSAGAGLWGRGGGMC